MNKRDSRRQELLDELARRFHDSGNALHAIARRIKAAGQATLAARGEARKASEQLRADLDVKDEVPFSYREFIEFGTAAEFRRFAGSPPLSDDDLQTIDWDHLLRQLAETESGAGETVA